MYDLVAKSDSMMSWAGLGSNLGPATNLPCAPSTIRLCNVQALRGILINKRESLKVIAQQVLRSVPSVPCSPSSQANPLT